MTPVRGLIDPPNWLRPIGGKLLPQNKKEKTLQKKKSKNQEITEFGTEINQFDTRKSIKINYNK